MCINDQVIKVLKKDGRMWVWSVLCDITVPLLLLLLSACAVIWRTPWWTWIMVTRSRGTTWVPCCHKCVRSCSSSCSRTHTAPWASGPAASWWCCRVLLTTNALPLRSPLAHLQSYRLSRAPTPSLALPVQLTVLLLSSTNDPQRVAGWEL